MPSGANVFEISDNQYPAHGPDSTAVPCCGASAPLLPPPDSASTAASPAPALGFPVCFASRVMGPIRSGWLSAKGSACHPVVVKQPERVIEPLPTPPLPAESCTLPGAGS